MWALALSHPLSFVYPQCRAFAFFDWCCLLPRLLSRVHPQLRAFAFFAVTTAASQSFQKNLKVEAFKSWLLQIRRQRDVERDAEAKALRTKVAALQRTVADQEVRAGRMVRTPPQSTQALCS